MRIILAGDEVEIYLARPKQYCVFRLTYWYNEKDEVTSSDQYQALTKTYRTSAQPLLPLFRPIFIGGFISLDYMPLS